jgi:methionyl-tRNA formyltransferase
LIAILTTKTVHHVFFENSIFKKFNSIITIHEINSIKPHFSTKVHFESKRDLYERKVFFKNKKFKFKSNSFKVADINSKKTIDILEKNNIKFILVFGTRKISRNIVDRFYGSIFNLHGGNPEKYRGLDSHYWSIYHGDFKLDTCLHVLNNKLDDGKIIFKKCIKLKKNLRIFQLRELNTINCIDITLNLFRLLHLGKKIKTTKQKNIGRYYSFMPSQLKINLEKKFLNYCNKLK